MFPKAEKETDKFIAYIKENKWLIFTLIFTVILTYGFEMSNFALTIDEESNWNKAGIEYLVRRISDGRFFLGFLKVFFPRVFLPFWSTLVYAIGMVLCGCLLVFIFKDYLKNTVSKVAVGCIFVSFPVHAFYVMFSQQSVETALAYFMTIYAVYLADKALKKAGMNASPFVRAGILVILSNGVYQTFFVVYVILVCALICVDLLADDYSESDETSINTKIYWKRIGGHILCLGASGIGYIVVTKVLQWLINPSRNYIESYIQWGTYDFVKTIKIFLNEIIRIAWNTMDDNAYVTMWVFTALFIVLFLIGFMRCKGKYKVIFMIAMCGLFFSNFLMMFAAGNTVPVRLYITLPIFAAIVLGIFCEMTVRENTQTAFGIFVVAIVLIQSANVTDLFWAEDRRQENDKVMMTKLTSEIADIGGAWIPEEPVVICNDYSWESYEGTFGFSYFTMGEKIYGYLEMNGFDYLDGSAEQIRFASEYAETMPAFPEEGSVAKENGVIIVNMQ